MSYVLKVLKDNPCGFWKLSGNGTDSSSGYFSSGTRTQNDATLSGVTTADIAPITTGGSSACKMVNGSTITIPNAYKFFARGSERESYSIAFWLAFSSIPSNANVFSTTNESGNITFTVADNLATLKIIDGYNNTYYSYLEVDTYDSQLYVVIVYENKSIYFYINGIKSDAAPLSSSHIFKDSTAQQLQFGAATTSTFYIDCISMYQYALTPSQIQNAYGFGLSDQYARAYTVERSGGYFNPSENDGVTDTHFIFNSASSWNRGKAMNCVLENGYLTSKYIPDATMYNPIKDPAQVPTYSSSGLTVASGSSDSVIFDNFDDYYTPNNQTITAQCYIGSDTTGTYFNITGFNFGQLLVKKTGSTTFAVSSPEGAFTDISFTGTSSTWSNLKISFVGNIIKAIVGASTQTATISSVTNVTISDAVLYAGNSYLDTSGSGIVTTSPNMTNLVRNISIFDNTDAASLSDFTSFGRFTLSLNSRLSISQSGYWEVMIAPASSSTIIGSMALRGTSSANVKLFAKTASGSYTQQSVNGESIPNAPIGAAFVPMFIKVTIDTTTSSAYRPKLKFLEVATYTNLQSHVDTGRPHVLTPYTTGTYYHTYQFRQSAYNPLARPWNLGYHFEPDNTNGAGKATIAPVSITYQSVEFWFKLNTSPSAATSVIIDNGTVSLSYNSSRVLSFGGFTAAYINGAAYTSGTKTLVVGEIYHFVGVISTTQSASVVLNGSSTYTNPAACDFGDIAIYSSALTAAQVLKKYNKILGIDPASTVSDSATITPSDSVALHVANWHNAPISVQ